MAKDSYCLFKACSGKEFYDCQDTLQGGPVRVTALEDGVSVATRYFTELWSIPYPASPGHDYLFFIYDVNNDIMHLPQFYSIRMEFWVTKESRHVFKESLSYSVFVLDDKQGEEGV